MSTDLDQRLAAIDPAARPDEHADPAAAGELLARVLACPTSERGHRRTPVGPTKETRRRLVVAGGWVTTIAATAVALTVIAHQPTPNGPSSALVPVTTTAPTVSLVSSSERSDGSVVVKITDKNAGGAQLSDAFRANDLRINVTEVPVSPSLVGTVLFSDFGATAIDGTGRCSVDRLANCATGFVVPADYAGKGEVVVGRQAGETESYDESVFGFAPGEDFHCEGLINAPVAEVVAFLKSKGVTAEFNDDTDLGNNTGFSSRRPADAPLPKGYVVMGAPLTPTTILLDTSEKPTDNASYLAEINAGC